MIENINLEEKIDNILKKLNSLLENLSSNLSKEKTESALNEGYNYIKEIENIIDIMEKTKKEEYNKTYLFMIKGDLMKKKEKFENFQKIYILNKSNQLIDSVSTNYHQSEENINSNDINNEYENDDNFIFEENINDKDTYEKNFIDEYFKENKNVIELSEGYLYNDNYIYKIKRNIHKIFFKIYNKTRKIKANSRYIIVLFLLMILLVFCIIRLYFAIINDIK